MYMSKDVILTGLRTNSEYHLGNYLGALLPMIELQKKHLSEFQINMFAPDLHSFTTEIHHEQLYDQTLQNLRVFVAAGLPLESENFNLYRQSYIPAHSELTVILNNFTYYGELSRMTQFKDKSNTHDTVSAGLFDYPVLMASDILLYDAQWVPVGDDQRQHLELTRDIAIRINNKFGDIFTIPHDWSTQLKFSGRSEGVRIRSLRQPLNKMSKSIDDPLGTIKLSDSVDDVVKKIRSSETDSVGAIHWDWENQPGITNLLLIYALLTYRPIEHITQEWEGRERYGDLKNAVADVAAQFIINFQESLQNVDEPTLMNKIIMCEAKMNEVANKKLSIVQKAVGLRK